jgi:N-acetylglucosamine kinase-like BadF-type ATPase
MQQAVPEQADLLALGIDAGGTETRWALATHLGEIVAEGHLQGFSALDRTGPSQAKVAAILKDLARAVLAAGHPVRVHAGLTGFGAAQEGLVRLVAAPLGLPDEAVTLSSDIETAYLDLFSLGQGYMVYAGTGSVAAFIDEAGALHRIGGRGVLIDDGGGGYWIAREGLRHVWRAEDERPGCWQTSPMAQELFALVGGGDWAHTRQYVYSGTRGDVGRLALAVAGAADRDPIARDILRAAGTELARLARIMLSRFGPRPVALSGRAATLHPLISATMSEALPSGTSFAMRTCRGEHAAARLALRAATGAPHPTIQDLEP